MCIRDSQGNVVLAMTGRGQSTLAREADTHLDVAVPVEACPLQLAPTSSTTAALAMGDALAVAWLEHAASPPMTLPARTRPVPWAAACCCISPM